MTKRWHHETWPLWALVALIFGLGTCGKVAHAQEPTFTPTRDHLECADGKCTEFDFGKPWQRHSRLTVRNIYHDMFEFVDGVLYVQRPMKIVELWRTAEDTEFKVDGSICRHSACVHSGLPQNWKAAPGPACGARISHPYANGITVACIDWERLRAVAPGTAWKDGSETQVWVTAKRGDVIAVTVDGEKHYAPLSIWPDGTLGGVVVVRGIGHETVSVQIFSEEK